MKEGVRRGTEPYMFTGVLVGRESATVSRTEQVRRRVFCGIGWRSCCKGLRARTVTLVNAFDHSEKKLERVKALSEIEMVIVIGVRNALAA